MNYGFIYDRPRPEDDIFGGVTRLGDAILVENRDWQPFLPVFESQMSKYQDMMACVTFSALNCLETLAQCKYGQSLNFSDRFTAKLSGTTARGNSLVTVADSIRKYHGLVPETDWPMVDTFVWEDFYKQVPPDLKEKGKKYLENVTIQYEWVSDDAKSIWDALRRSPLQVAIYAYGPRSANGIYKRSLNQGNHAVMLCGGEYGKYWLIFDHYANEPLKKLAWDTIFWGAIRFDVVPQGEWEQQQYPMFQENCLYKLVEAPGGFYIFLAGKMRKIETVDHIADWMFRNKMTLLDTMKKTLVKKDLDGVPIYNFKGELIA